MEGSAMATAIVVPGFAEASPAAGAPEVVANSVIINNQQHQAPVAQHAGHTHTQQVQQVQQVVQAQQQVQAQQAQQAPPQQHEAQNHGTPMHGHQPADEDDDDEKYGQYGHDPDDYDSDPSDHEGLIPVPYMTLDPWFYRGEGHIQLRKCKECGLEEAFEASRNFCINLRC